MQSLYLLQYASRDFNSFTTALHWGLPGSGIKKLTGVMKTSGIIAIKSYYAVEYILVLFSWYVYVC